MIGRWVGAISALTIIANEKKYCFIVVPCVAFVQNCKTPFQDKNIEPLYAYAPL
jgi:hypothetical protein